MQQQHLALGPAERRERARQRLVLRAGINTIVSSARVGVGAIKRVDAAAGKRSQSALLLAVMSPREVAGDAKQPRCRVTDLGVVAIPAGPCALEHLRRQILGRRGREPPAQSSVDARVVALEELLERLRSCGDQLRVGAGRCRAHIVYLPVGRLWVPGGQPAQHGACV